MPGRARRISTLLTAVVLLGAVNVAADLGPHGAGLFVGPAVTLVLVGLARRAGLTWADLGLSRKTWRKGAAYAGVAVGLVAALYLVGAVLPLTSSAFLDSSYALSPGSALLTALVVIPVSTVLLEEVAFRGVLPGLVRHPLGTAWASTISAVLFGMWHILPSLRLDNPAVIDLVGPGPLGRVLVVVAVVATTAVAGLLFYEVRRRSGSVLASAGLHWATNGLGVLVSSAMWAAKAA